MVVVLSAPAGGHLCDRSLEQPQGTELLFLIKPQQRARRCWKKRAVQAFLITPQLMRLLCSELTPASRQQKKLFSIQLWILYFNWVYFYTCLGGTGERAHRQDAVTASVLRASCCPEKGWALCPIPLPWLHSLSNLLFSADVLSFGCVMKQTVIFNRCLQQLPVQAWLSGLCEGRNLNPLPHVYSCIMDDVLGGISEISCCTFCN